MSKKWQMRRYQEGDEEKIVFLMNSVKYGWHSLEYWRWKYKKNPFGFFKNIFIAEDEGRLVGHSAIIPIGFKFFDRTLLGAQDLDAVTLPEYRLSGIYTNLARTNFRKARKDIKFTYGIPGKFIYRGLFK
ncbi:MAG: GNAT family N-acetyltransferase, partial [Candidatus Methanofastidiosia archaeon]